jgi:hypothetical protein
VKIQEKGCGVGERFRNYAKPTTEGLMKKGIKEFGVKLEELGQ